MNQIGHIERSIDAAKSRTALFGEPDFKSALFAQLERLIPPKGILSLDVFDTLVLRDSLSELHRFVEIGEKLATQVNERGKIARPIDAFLARLLGTKATYRCSVPIDYCREGSLTEIHQLTSKLLLGDDSLANDFIVAELSYEAGRISPNGLLLDYLRKHRARGGRIVLISDMYMHAEQIGRLLDLVGIDNALYDKIFSSADTKVSKASGKIFPIVEKALSASPNDFLHIGDRLKDDFQNPRLRGWNALHLPIPQAEILARRRDHIAIANLLEKEYGVITDIQMPS